MPIFSGFEGERFQFNGVPNKFFNLITDEKIQVNAHFNSHKRIDLIGIKINKSKVQWTATNGQAEVNGKRLHHRSYLQDYTYVEIKSILESERVNTLFINAGKYKFDIVRNKNCSLVLPYFFNFNAVIYDGNARPHGIVGQTADFNGAPRIDSGEQGEGVIDGNPRDYLVSSLWSNDFKYNKFKE